MAIDIKTIDTVKVYVSNESVIQEGGKKTHHHILLLEWMTMY